MKNKQVGVQFETARKNLKCAVNEFNGIFTVIKPWASVSVLQPLTSGGHPWANIEYNRRIMG